MIEKYEGYRAKCNKCGEFFTESDCEFTVYDTMDDINERLADFEWEIRDDKVFYDICK